MEPRTRWQLRVDQDMENEIRLLAKNSRRSINQTCIYLIEIAIQCLEKNKSSMIEHQKKENLLNHSDHRNSA